MESGTIFLIILGAVFLIGAIFLILFLIARSKGKITLNLNKMEFRPGETITGTLNLKMKKPVEANALNVGLIGTLERTKMSMNSKNRMSQNTQTENIFDFKKPLDTQKVYSGESNYNFELLIPNDIYKQTTGNQVVDTLVKSAQILTGNTSKIKWYVTANLDMKGFDISNKIRINIA